MKQIIKTYEKLNQIPFPVRRISVAEYHKMGEMGIFKEDERVELIDGVIGEMSPKGSKHTASVMKLTNLLPRLLHGRALVSIQDPIVIDDDTEPEPDVAVIKPRDDAYASAHPRTDDVLLLIEVADTSLEYDREVKLPRYAAAGIPEVWIVNLVENVIEVYREPFVASGMGRYRIRMEFVEGDMLTSQSFPDLKIEANVVLV
ncbi:MAG: Uma2 family endonuclease [Candidatus Poribacteria bacterium]